MKNLVNDIAKMQLDEATKVPKGTRKPLTAKPMPNDPKDPTVLVRGFGRMRKSQAEKAGMAYVVEETDKQWGEGPDDPVEHDITEVVVVSSFPSIVKKIRDANKSEAEKIADKNLADKLKKMSPEEKVKKGWAHPSILDEAVETRIQMTMPLFIRLMEYAKEDAKDDMDLHRVAENLSAVDGVASMDHYNDLVKDAHQSDDVKEEIELDEMNKGPAPGWMLRQDAVLKKKVADAKAGRKELKKYAGKKIENKSAQLGEDRITPKAPRKGTLKWHMQQSQKKWDKEHPPVEPGDQMYGTAKILPKQK